jgi:hypothetical protein
MSVFSGCCGVLATLSRAAAKSTAARLRRLRIGSVHPHWVRRASVCEQCPLRVISCGQSYCGRPLLEHVRRDPVIDGCGCPTIAKAKDPAEHCPLDAHHRRARSMAGRCSCKWCAVDH